MHPSDHELTRLLGQDACAKLADAVGGTDWDVPTNTATRRGKELCTLLGEAAAVRLIATYGGDRLYVPYDHASVLARRRAEMQAMHRAGHSIPAIARSYRYEGRYCERQVREMLGMDAPKRYQPDLLGMEAE